MPLSSLLPLIIDRAKEKRAVERKSNRQRTIQDLAASLQGNLSPEERDKKQAKLFSLGGNPSASFLQPQPDLTSLFDKFDIDPTVREAFNTGALTLQQAFAINPNKKPPLTIESATELFNALGPEEQKRLGSPERMVALAKLKDRLGADFTNSVVGGSGDKTSQVEADVIRIKQILGDRDYKDLSLKQKAELDRRGFSPDDARKISGIDTKIISQAERTLFERLKSKHFEFQFGFDNLLAKFQSGDKNISPSVLSTLEKNFDKATGQLKKEVVIAEAERLQDIAEELARRQSGDVKAIDIPPELSSIVDELRKGGVKTKEEVRQLFKQAIEQGATDITEDQLKIILEMFD